MYSDGHCVDFMLAWCLAISIIEKKQHLVPITYGLHHWRLFVAQLRKEILILIILIACLKVKTDQRCSTNGSLLEHSTRTNLLESVQGWSIPLKNSIRLTFCSLAFKKCAYVFVPYTFICLTPVKFLAVCLSGLKYFCLTECRLSKFETAFLHDRVSFVIIAISQGAVFLTPRFSWRTVTLCLIFHVTVA